eukprot:scaffold103603_cov23-Tisochrysis_lutea.AAC.2
MLAPAALLPEGESASRSWYWGAAPPTAWARMARTACSAVSIPALARLRPCSPRYRPVSALRLILAEPASQRCPAYSIAPIRVASSHASWAAG